MKVLAHNVRVLALSQPTTSTEAYYRLQRMALIIGCSIAVALFVVTLVFCCCRGRRASGEAVTPTTPFADRATSLPTSKGRRRSYKTLHE